jgi:hypothetical protein
MTDGPTTPTPAGRSKPIFERVKDIILKPKEEWAVIDAEPATVGGIMTGYVLILAAIGPIASLIGQQLFGLNFGIISVKPPIGFSIATAVSGYILSVVGIFIIALLIDALAPSFSGTKNNVQAMKVAAYSWTAAWVAGIFNIIPMLAILGLVGLYSFYLLYLGAPRLMRVPQEKAAGYVVVVILAAIVIYVAIAMLAMRLVFSFYGLPGLTL